ncbi:hypothetical protein GIB67_030136, partial [Kingdonia uniflora]
ELTIVSGVPNSGKSEWIDALLCNINENVGWKFVLCSMENQSCDNILEPKLDELMNYIKEVTGILSDMISEQLTRGLSSMASPDDLFALFSSLRGYNSSHEFNQVPLAPPDMIAMVDNQILLDSYSHLGMYLRRCLLAFNLLKFEVLLTCHLMSRLGLKVDTQNVQIVAVLPIDIMDPTCIASLASFLKIRFGRLDILVNNVGVTGVVMDPETFGAFEDGFDSSVKKWKARLEQLTTRKTVIPLALWTRGMVLVCAYGFFGLWSIFGDDGIWTDL